MNRADRAARVVNSGQAGPRPAHGERVNLMGTGKDVNFNNDGEKFTIELDSLGHLNFLANTGRDLRMSILDDDNEVIVDGTVTIGGSGAFGGLQLKASDGDNTIFLGSTANQANILMGGGGHDGFVKIKDADGSVAIDMRGDTGFLGVGTSGNDGAVNVNDSAGKPYISMGSGQLNVNVDGLPTIKLDGTLATVTVGSSTARGIIDVCDGTGAVTIKLSGDGGLIEYDQIQQDTTPDGKFPVQVAHQPVEGALARVRALQAI